MTLAWVKLTKLDRPPPNLSGLQEALIAWWEGRTAWWEGRTAKVEGEPRKQIGVHDVIGPKVSQKHGVGI